MKAHCRAMFQGAIQAITTVYMYNIMYIHTYT